MSLELRAIGTANLPDAVRLCLAGKSLGDRPRGFSREAEVEATRCKLSLLRPALGAGGAAFAAYRSGMLVGYAEAHPVERAPAPVEGQGFLVVHCLRVPESEERGEVEPALVDAIAAKAPGGLAVVAREKDWEPFGFRTVERAASEVEPEERVLWWRGPDPGGAAEAARARLVPVRRDLPRPRDKARVDLFTSDRCPWDRYVFDLVRGVAATLRSEVALFETDCNRRREVLRHGVVSAVAVNARFQPWVRPWRLPDEHTIRRTIEAAV